MAGKVGEIGRARVAVTLDGSGESNVTTGLPVLDHLLGLLAVYGSLDITLRVAPTGADEEVAVCGQSPGRGATKRSPCDRRPRARLGCDPC